MKPLRLVPVLLAFCGQMSALAAEATEFEVLESRTEVETRVEPAPLPGMVPVGKTVAVTVQEVADPGLPDPVPPVPGAVDPEKAAAFRARLAAHPRPVFLSLSAVVYDHESTRLRWSVKGAPGTPETEYEAWSNVDWELLCGHGRLSHNGVEYNLFASLFLYDTAALRHRAMRLGTPYVPPPIPGLPPDETPAFVVTRGDSSDTAATAAITALHEYFGAHRAELEAARVAREEAKRQREAELRANPPEPRDVTVRFWNRVTQVERPAHPGSPATPTAPVLPATGGQ